MNHSEELDQLATALSSAQAEFGAIPKTEDNPFYKSKFAPLSKVVELSSPILTKHGLAVSQFLGIDESGDTLTTWLLHKSGQFISQSMRLHLTKQDAQGQGSATTYARRYSYMAVLGLVADKDDDGNGASDPPGKAPRQQTPPSPPSNGHLATAEDIKALKSAAKGLKVAQIRLAMTSCGLDAPENVSAGLALVPTAKVQLLAEALAGVERE